MERRSTSIVTRAGTWVWNGIHKCLGAPLAKLETLITTKFVGQTVGGIALDPLRPIRYVRGNNLTNSGPEHLYVTIDAYRS